MIASKQKFFCKAVPFLKVSSERNDIGRNLRDRTLVSQNESPDELVIKFLQSTGYNFLDDLIQEIRAALTDECPIIPAFNVFLPSEATSLLDRDEQLEILRSQYGEERTDTYNNESNKAVKLIDPMEQKFESEEFFSEFEDRYVLFLDKVKSLAKKKLQSGELKQSLMYEYINSNKPTSSEVYSAMCDTGCLMRYPQTMKLFKFSLLIPPSTSGVERGFSAMNLTVSLLRTNLNQLSVNRFMQIAINGPESFNERDMKKLVDNYKNNGNRRIGQ